MRFHEESNLDLRFRKPLFYPLNYGGGRQIIIRNTQNYKPEVALKSCSPITLFKRRGITQTLQSQVKVGSGDLVEMKIFESLMILHVRG